MSWDRALGAAAALAPSHRAEAERLLQELRDALEGRRSTEGVKECLFRLIGYGDKFFIQVLPALLQYAQVLGPILGT